MSSCSTSELMGCGTVSVRPPSNMEKPFKAIMIGPPGSGKGT